tara:strand:- start:10 stop:237 length:228 start_codon:yes stop_codon:yes gene_type:complete
LTEGFGAGVLYPKTDMSLLEKERHDDYYLFGWGVSAIAGLNISSFKTILLSVGNLDNLKKNSLDRHVFYQHRLIF